MKSADSLIADCYRNFLLREPSAAEVEGWQKLLDSGSISSSRIPERFKNSPEFHALRSILATSKVGFLHVPKTAGTTFKEWLRALYFESEIFEDGRTWNPEASEAKFLCGHLHLSFFRDCGCTHLFTIFRDPAERLLSLYRFGRSMVSQWPADDPVKTLGFEDWLRCADVRARAHQNNFYASLVLNEEELAGLNHEALLSRALQRYREFTIVGIQEDLPSFYARVAAKLSIPPPLVTLAHNSAEQNALVDANYTERPHLSESCRALLTEITKLDRAIYEHVRKEVITLTSSTNIGNT